MLTFGQQLYEVTVNRMCWNCCHIPWILVLALLVILLKFKTKYCFKKILFKARLHFLVLFSFETQFEVHLNDSEKLFEEDIFAQTMEILQWCALDQTVRNLTHFLMKTISCDSGWNKTMYS